MRTVLCAIAIAAAAVAQCAQAEVPPGPDAINGAFVRLMAYEATTVIVPAAATREADRMFERWVDRVARNEVSSADAGFAHMLARCGEIPAPLAVRGEPDPVAMLIADALQVQRDGVQALALVD